MSATASATIQINAPIDLVWQVMTDLSAYPQWNPFIVRVDGPQGPASVGQKLRLHVRWNSGGGVISPELVSRWEGPAAKDTDLKTATLAYRYDGLPHTLNLARGTRVQTLSQHGRAPTCYETHEAFTGLLCRLIPLAKVRDGFARHAEALRVRAEELAGTAPLRV